MSQVTCVLLHHVREDPANVTRVRNATPIAVVDDLVEAASGGGRLRKLSLSSESLEISLGVGCVDFIEVGVEVAVTPVLIRNVITEDSNAEPHTLDIGHVTNQAEQRQSGGLA